MNKITKILLAITMMFSFGFIKNVSADEIKIEQIIHEVEMPEENKVIENIGLTHINPFEMGDFGLYGLSKPSSSSV